MKAGIMYLLGFVIQIIPIAALMVSMYKYLNFGTCAIGLVVWFIGQILMLRYATKGLNKKL